jgi:adenylosuccinate lyase
MLLAVSPIDGRYANQTEDLQNFFSEFGLIRYRVLVEVEYLLALTRLPLPQLRNFPEKAGDQLLRMVNQFSPEQAQRIKEIEKTTNHDVKAVEYFLKEELDRMGLGAYREFVHFGLTSQDINNTASPMAFRDAQVLLLLPRLEQVQQALIEKAEAWKDVPMLARTHGQPASPTLLGKEVRVFAERIRLQREQLEAIPHAAKFGGATGNMNAHYAAYPDINWHQFARDFLQNSLGLSRSEPTTQIEHYDFLAAQMQALARINTILMDWCRDAWQYIAMEYFRQQVKAGEVGSSAMPHKVNPIDFENAEGNFGVANALYNHLAAKLPISRLQRDLTDSTVLRNLGTPVGHTLIGYNSVLKGMGKLILNPEQLERDLNHNWAVLAEAIQSILRREGYPQPYEALKALTRGQAEITRHTLHTFIDTLDVSPAVRTELKALTPSNYTGAGS